jgi:two-component system cell cycle response regulator PopA
LAAFTLPVCLRARTADIGTSTGEIEPLRIVVRCQDSRAARAAQDLLSCAGVTALALPGAPEHPFAAPEGEDAIIIAEPERDIALRYAEAARTAGRLPLAILWGVNVGAPPPSGLEAPGEFTGVIALDAAPALLAAQVSAAIRTGAAEEERDRRGATLRLLGGAAPKPVKHRKLKALYIGAPSPIFLSLEAAFGSHGGLVAAAFSSFSGFDHLHDEAFDAVVLNGANDAATALSLCSALRRNASLYHLPTMMVISPGDDATAATAIERGASSIAPVNAPSDVSMAWLFEAIRRERRRTSAEHDSRALGDAMGDPRTGLFRRAAFDAHLNQLALDHHASGRPLAVAALRVLPAHGASTPSEQVWSRGFTEIASLAARLIRDADCGATLGSEWIVLALPATDDAGGRRTAERIASVAECTAFASGEGGAGPLVFEQSVVEMQAGESGAGLMARALRALEYESVA